MFKFTFKCGTVKITEYHKADKHGNKFYDSVTATKYAFELAKARDWGVVGVDEVKEN